MVAVGGVAGVAPTGTPSRRAGWVSGAAPDEPSDGVVSHSQPGVAVLVEYWLYCRRAEGPAVPAAATASGPNSPSRSASTRPREPTTPVVPLWRANDFDPVCQLLAAPGQRTRSWRDPSVTATSSSRPSPSKSTVSRAWTGTVAPLSEPPGMSPPGD